MKNFLFVVLLAFIMVEILVLFPNQLEKSQSTDVGMDTVGVAGTADPGAASQKILGLHLVESKSGQQDWELFADSAEAGQGQTAWNLANVKVLFFTQGGAEFTVTGKTGSVDSQTKDLHIKGDVLTRSKNGYILETDYVEYSSSKREIRCPTNVKMVGPKDAHGDGLNVTGYGLVAQVDTSVILINKDIHAIKLTKDQKKLEITSSKAEFSSKSREAKFINDVVIQYDQMVLTGDFAEFRYGVQKDLFDFVNVHGNVKVNDGNRQATSENLDMDMLTNRFVFTGNPKLIQEGDELVGEKIIFLDRGKRVKVDKTNASGTKIPGT